MLMYKSKISIFVIMVNFIFNDFVLIYVKTIVPVTPKIPDVHEPKPEGKYTAPTKML